MIKRSIALLLIMIMIASVFAGCQGNQEEEETLENFTAVEVQAAQLGDIENSVAINGRVAASQEVSIMPKAMGTVASLNVELGDSVKEGDTLFVIEQTDMNLSV